ncbi:PepSY-like domain-containing protein [Chryseobacterium sp. Ch-15]|uniref:PepSY-like domain-containing protein n=1 Tax=Chryseobacterium muglaense TaxID=2893752 RepID=A0A9Q3YR94_9FLAO|nr:PepSY-like domain-containing protein [Chryseobacterium muglaense]MBD3903512.1 PepSY-like domain-containing protein [Chryseobacterium muglaense]MCC9034584.1 PepSY-like domain-containing protein [Chryseobacterium muglaense]MCM2552847.1 PepSY-like domain-containing protein [Chryseobacterium muglaense]
MKNLILTISILGLSLTTISAQDIHQNEVPSVILNSFQKSFPKASDIDWEIKGNLYEVEFETGFLGDDHKVLYSRDGKLVRHEEEISKSNLPKTVLVSIKKSFPGYRTDDIKKITEGGKVIYKIELKNYSQEWKVIFDTQGRILQKIAD